MVHAEDAHVADFAVVCPVGFVLGTDFTPTDRFLYEERIVRGGVGGRFCGCCCTAGGRSGGGVLGQTTLGRRIITGSDDAGMSKHSEEVRNESKDEEGPVTEGERRGKIDKERAHK